MANQRWTADKNIQFINEYQRNECLWNPKHPQYKNRDARDAAYKIIMEAMEMETVKEVVGKIRTLRNTYNNETLKAKKSNRTGMGTNKLYISKIPWLPHLNFFKNIDSYKRGNTENVAPSFTQESSVSESDSQDFTIPRTPTRKRKIFDPLLKAVDALKKVSMQQHFSATADEFDLFGQTVAQQLRQLPLETALKTEEIILSTIRKQRTRVRNPSSSVQYVGSTRIHTITTPQEQQISQRASSWESKFIASTSTSGPTSNSENE